MSSSILTSRTRPTDSDQSALRRETSFKRIKQRSTSVYNILSAFERVLRERVGRKRLVRFSKIGWRSHVLRTRLADRMRSDEGDKQGESNTGPTDLLESE